MIKRSILTFALLITSAIASFNSFACTNIIATKGATIDKSALISYAADSHWLYGELYFHPAKDWKEGEMLKVYEWDTGRYLGEIPQVAHTYQTLGNMNEHQLIITETTYGGRKELRDPNGGIDYGSMIYITLQRAKTAREAIKVLTDLANTYGYCSSGESMSISDKNETWILELIGKGVNLRNGVNLHKGIVWVARRVPDGYITAHANQARIQKFPLDDPQNCLYSEDVIEFARDKGYFDGEDEDFDFSAAYCPFGFGTARACDARVWAAFNLLCDGWFTYKDEDGKLVTKDAFDFVDYAMGYDKTKRLPLFVKPMKKLSVKDIADAMRDHYEGTPLDMTTDIGAGGNGLPYRWRPMHFKYQDDEFLNERAIATQQTAFWMIGQARGYYPDEIGGVLWFGTDDAATSYLTPIYACTREVPECFKEGNGNLLEYSATSSFWINNRVTNSCYRMYNQMAPFVKSKIDEYENLMVKSGLKESDKKAIEIYNKIAKRLQRKYKASKRIPIMFSRDPFKKVKKYLTKVSIKRADEQFEAWKKLEETLLIKFIDGNVKAQNKDGSFKHTENGKGVPADLTQPGYTEKWKEAVAKDNGATLKVRK